MKSPRTMMKLIQAMGGMVRAKNKSKDTSAAPWTERDWSTRATLAESAVNRVEKQIMRVSVSKT